MADSTIQQKLTAEVIGTFVLVFFGCGSVVYPAAGGDESRSPRSASPSASRSW